MLFFLFFFLTFGIDSVCWGSLFLFSDVKCLIYLFKLSKGLTVQPWLFWNALGSPPASVSLECWKASTTAWPHCSFHSWFIPELLYRQSITCCETNLSISFSSRTLLLFKNDTFVSDVGAYTCVWLLWMWYVPASLSVRTLEDWLRYWPCSLLCLDRCLNCFALYTPC